MQCNAGSLLPDPFSLSPESRPAGVYLHWALPDALTRGAQTPSATQSSGDQTQTSDAETIFPAIPDRWLVVRLSPSTTHPDRRAVKGWILQAHDQNATRHDLDGWKEPGPPPGIQKALTALGWGDISWAGYFDNTENRLAMYDDLSGIKQGPLAYLVCGWYSDSALDPLGPASVASLSQFNAAMQKLGWALPDVDLTQPKASAGNHVVAARMVGLPVNRIRTNAQLNSFPAFETAKRGRAFRLRSGQRHLQYRWFMVAADEPLARRCSRHRLARCWMGRKSDGSVESQDTRSLGRPGRARWTS